MYLLQTGSITLSNFRESSACIPHEISGIKLIPRPAIINCLTIEGTSLSNTIVGLKPAYLQSE